LKKLNRQLAQADALACFGRALDAFQPQLVLFIAPFHQTEFILAARALSQAVIAAWVGDRFSREDVVAANACHMIYFSDSGFLTLAEEFNFASATQWLPLATATRQASAHTRKSQGVFVGNATAQRQAFLASVTEKLRVLGPGWNTSVLLQHQVSASKIAPGNLPSIYAEHAWGLNMCNENNVINGLNHRSFEPYIQGTPVFHDDMADLPRCFEPEREILIYRDAEQLVELSRRAKHSPAWLSHIGMQGQRRVLAEHTYLHRAQTILNDLLSD
jgi:spore maturation protein CgeB